MVVDSFHAVAALGNLDVPISLIFSLGWRETRAHQSTMTASWGSIDFARLAVLDRDGTVFDSEVPRIRYQSTSRRGMRDGKRRIEISWQYAWNHSDGENGLSTLSVG